MGLKCQSNKLPLFKILLIGQTRMSVPLGYKSNKLLIFELRREINAS